MTWLSPSAGGGEAAATSSITVGLSRGRRVCRVRAAKASHIAWRKGDLPSFSCSLGESDWPLPFAYASPAGAAGRERSRCGRAQRLLALQHWHVKKKRMTRGRNFPGILWLPAQSLRTSPRKGAGFVLALVPLGKGTLALPSVSPHQIHKLNLWSSLGIFFFHGSDGLAFSG